MNRIGAFVASNMQREPGQCKIILLLIIYIYIHVYIYVYIYIYMFIYIYYVYIYICFYIYMFIYICLYIYEYTAILLGRTGLCTKWQALKHLETTEWGQCEQECKLFMFGYPTSWHRRI